MLLADENPLVSRLSGEKAIFGKYWKLYAGNHIVEVIEVIQASSYTYFIC